MGTLKRSHILSGIWISIFLSVTLSQPVLGASEGSAVTPTSGISQDLTGYASSNRIQRLVPETIQKWRDSEFNSRYFSPWHRTVPAYATTLPYLINSFVSGTFYGENKLPIPADSVNSMIANMATANYPSRIAPAITITQTNLRIVPTVRPFFRSFDLPGEGYPFDYNQESGVQAMTPLLVTHVSQDMAWVLVETADLSGWLPVQDIAWIDEDQIRRIENRPLVAVVRDEFPLLDTNGQFVLTARIGALFPVINESDRDYRIWIIKRNTDGRAVFEETVLTKQQAQSKPVPLTPQNLAQLGNQMMGQNYGWGDILGNRDCSSMLQDLMAPFGIWLPRNGNDQGRAGGYYFSLKHLSPEDKEKTIVQNGVPFLTLLWLKGHIMLYVGPSDTGQALVFHNIWGIRTRDLRGAEGRYILGKAMVTTLSPGRTVPFADPDGDILKRLEGMTMLMPRFY